MAIERYEPSLGGEIRYEHLHRYALARELVCGKSVLDLGCGEGYGAALLAQVAESVVGVDIDRECVTQAAQKYGDAGNVEFLVGACDAIPLPGESVDVVTCFETIEHHEQHEEMMREVKRILKPGGKLVVSSPNPVVYTEKAESSNPFHVKELYDYQLLSLLNRYFQQVKLYGQRLATGSFVFPMRHSQQQDWLAYTGEDTQVRRQVCELEEPKYFLAVAADVELGEVAIGSLYVDGQDDLLADLRQQLQALQANPSQEDWEQSKAELERVRQELQETKSQLEKVRQERQQEQEECKQVKSELNETREKLEESEFQLDEVQGDLADTHVQLQEKQQEVEKVRSEVQEKQQQWEQSQEQLQQEQLQRQQVQQELEESQQELQQEQQQRSQVQKQLEESQQNEQQIREERQQLETERDRLQEQLQQSQQQYQQLETERDRLQEQLQQSQQQSQQLETERDSLQEQLQQSQQQSQQLETERDRLQEQLQQSQQEYQQLQTERDRLQEQLQQSQQELEKANGEIQDKEEEQSLLELQLHQIQADYESSWLKLQQVQGELGKLQIKQEFSSTQSPHQKEYYLLLWEAWHSYSYGNNRRMRECLQKSLKYSPLPRTETVLKWVEDLTEFAKQDGKQLNTKMLMGTPEWKQLMQRTMVAKPTNSNC